MYLVCRVWKNLTPSSRGEGQNNLRPLWCWGVMDDGAADHR
jgi:hypothetical protein